MCSFSLKYEYGNQENNYFFTKKRPENPSEVITVCPFCDMSLNFHDGNLCESRSDDNHASSMQLIFYPYLSQSEINLIANLLVSIKNDPDFFSQNIGDNYSETAKIIFDSIAKHSSYVYSDAISIPEIANPLRVDEAVKYLQKQFPDIKERGKEIMAGFRIFPIDGEFEDQSRLWSNQWKVFFNFEKIFDDI